MLFRGISSWSIRSKTLLAFVGIAVAVLSSTSLLIIRETKTYLTAQHASVAMRMAESLAMATDLATMTGDKKELSRLASAWQHRDGVLYVRIETPKGKLLAEAGHSPAQTLVLPHTATSMVFADYSLGAAMIKPVTATENSDLSGTDHEFVPAETTQGVSATIGRVLIATSTDQLNAEINRKGMMIVGVLSGAGISSFFLTLLGINSLTRRLSRLSAASERISGGDLSEPLLDSSGDELGRLALAFESMRTSLHAREIEMQELNNTLLDKVRIRTADLENAMHAAEAASRAKSDFLANMSHEIRTPMAAIIGNAELLSEPDQTNEQKVQRIGTIQRSGEHLLSLINDILDISKIEAGKMSVEQLPCSPRELLQDVHALMLPRATSKTLRLEIEYETPLPETISSDPMRLRQILLNLVSNALKFTAAGSVTIRASARVTESDGELIVKVIDTGIGMSADSVSRLFRAFEQADNTMSRRFGGTGLGLVIARRLANLLRGDVLVTSVPGAGSTFTLVVSTGSLNGVTFHKECGPRSAPTPITTTTDTTNLVGSRILLVEDGLDNQRLIIHHLTKAGAKVQLAENGKLGLEAHEASVRSAMPFQLVLMDMQMPEMDGYAATAELRKRGSLVPIVALTAHALTGDRERCLAAGCDDYATKPVNQSTLLRMCDQWISSGSSRKAA